MDIAASRLKIDYGIYDQLARPVKSYVAAAIDVQDLYAAFF